MPDAIQALLSADKGVKIGTLQHVEDILRSAGILKVEHLSRQPAEVFIF